MSRATPLNSIMVLRRSSTYRDDAEAHDEGTWGEEGEEQKEKNTTRISIQYHTTCSTQYTAHSTQHTVHSTQYTVHSMDVSSPLLLLCHFSSPDLPQVVCCGGANIDRHIASPLHDDQHVEPPPA